ncbi:UNVERIFIED_CONTAM: protein TIFY 11B [Sesamum latifolium]|uniref:Protein TIFY n=1 Tax=Sesamum latifolium TaxID=2727402 RepID=A0AAW2YDD9_9LAMI
MSSYSHIADGRRLGKAPEKSNFVQTCNLLSRYIKEKGSLRDLNLEIGGKVESLEAIVKPGSSISPPASAAINKVKSAQPLTDQHPPITPHDSSINTAEHAPHKQTSKEAMTADPKTAQLTIFYSGKVLVFDDYPADKARELMAFAKKGALKCLTAFCRTPWGKSRAPAALWPWPPPPAHEMGFRHGLKRVAIIRVSAFRRTLVRKNRTLRLVGLWRRTREQKNGFLHSRSLTVPICQLREGHHFIGSLRRGKIGTNVTITSTNGWAAGGGPYHQVQDQAAASPCKGDEGQLELKL